MDENSATQEQQPGAESQPSEAPGKNGVEIRINQLVAERSEAQRRASELEAQLVQMTAQQAQLMEAVTQRFASAAPAPVAEPVVEVDPDEQRRIAYVAKSLFGGQMDAITRTLNQTQAMLAELKGHQTVQNLPYKVSPEIMAKAEKLYREVNAKGIPYNLEDAVKHTIGETLMAQEVAKARAAGERARMNGTGSPVIPFQSGAPVSTSVQGPRGDLPPNFYQMSPKEQLKLLRARGVEDAPL